MSFDLGKNEKLSSWWRFITFAVMVVGFSVLGLITRISYDNTPPIPGKIVSTNGQLLFTGEQITRGQSVFLKNNLQ